MKKEWPAPSTLRVTRITPSAPTPNRRWHSAATSPEESGSSSSRSSSMTKSLPVPWYFHTRSSVTLEILRQLVHQVDRAALAAGEPPDPGVSSEPDHLASRQFPRPPHRLRRGLREGDLAPEVPRELSVPDGPAGGEPPEQSPVEQDADLIEEPAVDHRPDASLDSAGQRVRRHVDPRSPNPIVRVALPPVREAREGAPGDRGNLERANRSPDVRRLDPAGGDRIELDQARVQAIRADDVGLGLELVAGGDVRPRELQVVDDGPEVQAGAADQQ